jgi:uncharacterized Tic20 family protein
MTTNPSQPAPERRASGPVSSEPLDALPAPDERFVPTDQRPRAGSQDRWPTGPHKAATSPGRDKAADAATREKPAGGPEPGQPAAAPSRDKAATAAPGPAKLATAPERAPGGQTQVITREHAEPVADSAGRSAADLNDHRLAMLSYLGVPFLGPVIPLAIYLIKKRASAFVRYHSAQALNLSITALLYTVCILILATMLALDSIVVALIAGVTLAVVLWLATLAYVILAGSGANRGRYYRIPGWLCATIAR